MCWSKGHVWIMISVGSLSHGDWSLCFNHGRLLTARPCCPEMEGPTGPTFWACRVAGNGPGCQVGESGVLSSRLSLWCWDCSSLCVCLVYSEEQRVLDFAEVHSIDFFSALIATVGCVSDSRKRIWQPDLRSPRPTHSYGNAGHRKNHQPGELHGRAPESITGDGARAGSAGGCVCKKCYPPTDSSLEKVDLIRSCSDQTG